MYAVGSGDTRTAQNVPIKEQSQAPCSSDLLCSLKCAIPVVCVETDKWVCGPKHNCMCLIRCYILR